MQICFVVGSPRSGTTVFAEVLGRHPGIAQMYEPYFLWDRYVGPREDDVRTAADATPAVADYVRHEFELFLRRSGKQVLVEKTPENSFRIPMIRAVFPEARWIHLVRDGRDAVVSIRREWRKRREVSRGSNPLAVLPVAWSMLSRQPYWRNRWQALAFELSHTPIANLARLRNKAKWKGHMGWGPRFPGWEQALAGAGDIVEFNAMQWRESVAAVRESFGDLPAEQILTVHYEQFVREPEREFGKVVRFLGLDPVAGLASDIRDRSVGQYRTQLTAEEQRRIAPVLGDMLVTLGYEADRQWTAA